MADPPPSLPILGVGAGGHAKSVLDALRSGGRFEIVAILDDDPNKVGANFVDVAVAETETLERYRDDGVRHAFVGVGGTRESGPRRRVFALLNEAGFELPAIVHASAVVSPRARIAEGAQILAAAVVNADADIGRGAIVNTGAIVEHDCRVGAHAHIAPRAVLGGNVIVGSETHVGIGAVVIEGIEIGAGAFVAAGAVVVDDVERGTRVAGVPARPLVAEPS